MDVKGQRFRGTAVLVGVLFLASTATFAAGSSLVSSYFSGDSPATSTLLAGVLLEVSTGLAVVGIGLAMLPPLRRHNARLASAYLALRALECLAIVGVGGYMLARHQEVQRYDPVDLLVHGRGGIILSYLLLVSRLVPRPLSMLGQLGEAGNRLVAAAQQSFVDGIGSAILTAAVVLVVAAVIVAVRAPRPAGSEDGPAARSRQVGSRS